MTHSRTAPSRTAPSPTRPGGGRRSVNWLAAAALGGSLILTGCSIGGDGGGTASSSSSGSGSSCDLSGCTVTLQKGVNAKVSVLGIDVELVAVTGDQATLRVGGQEVSVPLEGQATTNVAGLDVAVQSADDTTIVLRITRA